MSRANRGRGARSRSSPRRRSSRRGASRCSTARSPRAIGRRDHTRPVVRHSGVLPGLAEPGTDSHLYHGWYHGDLRGLAANLRRWPRLGRFVSEFGAQAVPDHAEWMEPERWPDLDWERLARHHALQRDIFDRRMPPTDAKSFDEWRAMTQAYQAALLQLQIEDLRRLSTRRPVASPCSRSPIRSRSASWSVLDHEREPKRGVLRGARRVPPGARRWSSRAPDSCTSSTTPAKTCSRSRSRLGRRTRDALDRRRRRPTAWCSSAASKSPTRSTSKSCSNTHASVAS